VAEAQARVCTQLKGEEIWGDEARVERQWNQNEKEKGGRKGIEENEERGRALHALDEAKLRRG